MLLICHLLFKDTSQQLREKNLNLVYFFIFLFIYSFIYIVTSELGSLEIQLPVYDFQEAFFHDGTLNNLNTLKCLIIYLKSLTISKVIKSAHVPNVFSDNYLSRRSKTISDNWCPN